MAPSPAVGAVRDANSAVSSGQKTHTLHTMDGGLNWILWWQVAVCSMAPMAKCFFFLRDYYGTDVSVQSSRHDGMGRAWRMTAWPLSAFLHLGLRQLNNTLLWTWNLWHGTCLGTASVVYSCPWYRLQSVRPLLVSATGVLEFLDPVLCNPWSIV